MNVPLKHQKLQPGSVAFQAFFPIALLTLQNLLSSVDKVEIGKMKFSNNNHVYTIQRKISIFTGHYNSMFSIKQNKFAQLQVIKTLQCFNCTGKLKTICNYFVMDLSAEKSVPNGHSEGGIYELENIPIHWLQ